MVTKIELYLLKINITQTRSLVKVIIFRLSLGMKINCGKTTFFPTWNSKSEFSKTAKGNISHIERRRKPKPSN